MTLPLPSGAAVGACLRMLSRRSLSTTLPPSGQSLTASMGASSLAATVVPSSFPPQAAAGIAASGTLARVATTGLLCSTRAIWTTHWSSCSIAGMRGSWSIPTPVAMAVYLFALCAAIDCILFPKRTAAPSFLLMLPGGAVPPKARAGTVGEHEQERWKK